MDGHIEKIVDERVVYTGKVFSVLERDVEIQPGKVETFEVIRKKGTNTVAVVAIDDDTNVLLVEEYFGAVNARGLNLPSGKLGEGEDLFLAANRELQEETGFKGELAKLAELTVSPGYLSQRTTIFLASNLQASPLDSGDEDYYFKVHKVPLEKALGMCESGEISEARTVAGLLLAAKKLQ